MQVYAPILQADIKETENFYKRLQKNLSKDKEYFKIVMGYFNAKLGTQLDPESFNSIGKFCTRDTTNKNGEAMLNFTENNSLKIANSFY